MRESYTRTAAETQEVLKTYRRSKVVDRIFTCKSSQYFNTIMTTEKIDPQTRRSLLQDESVYSLISGMLDEPDKHRMPLGLAFTMLTIDDLPKDVQAKLPQSPTRIDVSLRTSFRSWAMCSEGVIKRSW